jgi:hypothetical protein
MQSSRRLSVLRPRGQVVEINDVHSYSMRLKVTLVAVVLLLAACLSAIGQNRPGIIEIKGLKTSHFKESKTAPLDRVGIGSMGHVQCPQSESANTRTNGL